MSETRIRKGLAKGSKNPMKNPKVAKKISLILKNRIFSNETRKKISKNRKGKCLGEDNPSKKLEVRLKIKNWYKDPKFKKKRKERGNNISEKLRGRKNSWMLATKNPNWTGGYFPNYYGGNWGSQRKLAIKKDKKKCKYKSDENCKGKLSVHHKKPFRIFIKEYVKSHNVKGLSYGEIADKVCLEANKLSNLVCLCAKHHKIEEIKLNKEYYYLNKENYLKFLKEKGVLLKKENNFNYFK